MDRGAFLPQARKARLAFSVGLDSLAPMASITTIRNLGPASAEAFRKAGITTAEEIQDMGADAAYARLLASGARPHFIGYYVLVMGLQGRPWNDCKGTEKARLRERFDEIVAGHFDPDRAALDSFMNEIGLIESPAGKPAP